METITKHELGIRQYRIAVGKIGAGAQRRFRQKVLTEQMFIAREQSYSKSIVLAIASPTFQVSREGAKVQAIQSVFGIPVVLSGEIEDGAIPVNQAIQFQPQLPVEGLLQGDGNGVKSPVRDWF